MGFLSNVIRPKAVSSTLESQIREYFGGGSTSSGVAVNSDSAMKLATVYACVKVLYQSIAQMPCHFMVQENDGKTKVTNKAMDHRLYRILHDQPNSWMSAPEFWGMSVAHVSLRGDFLAFKVMSGGQVRELLPIDPSRLQEIKQNSDWSLTYRISTADNWDGSKQGPAREYRDYSQKEIFHIRGMSLDGYSGLNPIAYARESIGVGMAAERFKAQYFGKGMHPGAVITHPYTQNTTNYLNQLEALKIKYAGLGNAQDVMLLEKDTTITFPAIKLVDQQFLENEKFTEARICGLFRVPLMLIQAGDNPTTFASAEQFMIAFVTHALTPIVVNIEKAIYRDLLTEEEKKNYFAKFEMRGLLRGAFKEQMEAFQIAVNTCIMNPNEVRDALDMNAYVGGEKYETRTSTVKQDGKAPVVPGEGIKAIRHLSIVNVGNDGKIQARKKDNVDWKKVYKEDGAHWADDMQPSKLAQEFAQKLVDENKKSVLEIGCGNGRDSILFALAGMDVTAIDLVPEAVEIAKENAKNAEVSINFQTGNAEKLQFADESFGGLFTLSVLHSTNMAKSIPEVYRVVKKRGIVRIYVYSNVEKIDGKKSEFVSVDEFVNLVKDAGFTLSDIYTTSDEEFDEAGEKHLAIIAELRK